MQSPNRYIFNYSSGVRHAAEIVKFIGEIHSHKEFDKFLNRYNAMLNAVPTKTYMYILHTRF